MASTSSASDDLKNPLAVDLATEEKPSGPLNVDPGVTGSPSDDVTSAEADEYVDGFSWRTVIGALFIGFIMMPGGIYLGLVSGQGLGAAAEWVTIILFMEVARRSYQTLKKQELYLLFYIGANLASTVGGIALAGGVFSGFIWNQYLVGSPFAASLGITHVPSWVVPPSGSPALLGRTFLHPDWLPAIGLMLFFQLFGRMNSWGLGYVLFRVTSDLERLPFPLAPIAAEGSTALAESSSQREGWRWRIFSIGAMIGVGWGAMYVLLPTVTGLVFSAPITILSNPFIDFTPNTQKILPAAQAALGTDLGAVLIGFVLPFPVIVGSFVSTVGAHIIANPILQKAGVLTHWSQGIDVQQTQAVNYFDFWLSFGAIGTSIAVAVIGICSVIKALNKRRQEVAAGPKGVKMWATPPGRGDIPMWVALVTWAIGAIAYVGMCHYLVPGFPIAILLFFAFIWTPLFSYINARLAGMAGTSVTIPYVREASIAMSGYRGTDIWFAPIPLQDYGGMASHFRTVELTRTKFTSIVKVELLMLPIMLICSFLFWSFIWRLAPIPSANYPYASKIWPVTAQQQLLWFTANKDAESNILLQALKPQYIAAGAAFAFAAYGATIALKLPTLFFYGLVNGIHGQPFGIIPMFIGGMLGRFYFSKRYGVENWRAYAPVLVAGFYCGMGLIGMAAVALALLSKSVSRLPF